MKTLTTQHYMALEAVGGKIFTIVQDDMPATFKAMRDIIDHYEGSEAGPLVEVLERTGTTLTVRRTPHGDDLVAATTDREKQRRLKL